MKKRWIVSICAVLAASVCAGAFMTGKPVAGAVTTPVYPKKTTFNDRTFNPAPDKEYRDGLAKFALDSAPKVLAQQAGKNSLYSPVSLYMALSMLAQTAGGDTQAELLKVLNASDAAGLAAQSKVLFDSLYTDNEIGKLNLANSVWLDQSVSFKEPALKTLTDNFYAYTFHTDLSAPDAAQKIGDWVNQNTGGKLGKIAEQSQQPNQLAALINTVYFYDQWSNEFDAVRTKKGDFHREDGSTSQCDYMYIDYGSHSFVKTEDYVSSSLSFKNGCRMVFILPEEGKSPDSLLARPDVLRKAILTEEAGDSAVSGEVEFQIPKFHFTNELALADQLKTMGAEKIFHQNADFSPLTDSEPFFVSGVIQAAAISIDEKGCEATAFTEIAMAGSAMPQGKASVILDRPFLFAIMSREDAPLFLGAIRDPS